MPYIPSKIRRGEMDEILKLMSEHQIQADGDLNYLLFKYCKYNVPTGYNSLKNFCGELRQCATEIERRLLAAHEDSVMEKNGDV